MEFKYKITKFDAENKIVVVVFDDSSWAEIRLANPLPATVEELEKIIKTYTAPKEVIEAQQAPSADLSYIESLVDVERTAERFSIAPQPLPPVVPTPPAFEFNLADSVIPTTIINGTTTSNQT